MSRDWTPEMRADAVAYGLCRACGTPRRPVKRIVQFGHGELRGGLSDRLEVEYTVGCYGDGCQGEPETVYDLPLGTPVPDAVQETLRALTAARAAVAARQARDYGEALWTAPDVVQDDLEAERQAADERTMRLLGTLTSFGATPR